ncbi:unnamed protein product [Urochloa humidicola]
MAAAAEGLAAYRAVLRAARRTFAGDQLMLKESAVEIRRRFEDHRGLAPGSDEAARALADAREAAHFITHMIVQATRGASGSFVVKPESVPRWRYTGGSFRGDPVKVEIGESIIAETHPS